MAKRKKNKRINNDLQNITHKTKDRVTWTPLKTRDKNFILMWHSKIWCVNCRILAIDFHNFSMNIQILNHLFLWIVRKQVYHYYFFQDFPPNLTEEELTSLIEIRSDKIKNTRETTSRNISVEQEKQKAQFAKRKTKKSETIGVGMQVLKYNANKWTRKGDRLQPEYSGPYTIEDIATGKVTLRNKDTNQVLKRKCAIKDLKIYHSDRKWYVLM